MASMADLLAAIHEEIATKLLARIKSGEASTADFNVARQFLKDNNIDSPRTAGNPIDTLTNSLPFAEDEEMRH